MFTFFDFHQRSQFQIELNTLLVKSAASNRGVRITCRRRERNSDHLVGILLLVNGSFQVDPVFQESNFDTGFRILYLILVRKWRDAACCQQRNLRAVRRETVNLRISIFQAVNTEVYVTGFRQRTTYFQVRKHIAVFQAGDRFSQNRLKALTPG